MDAIRGLLVDIDGVLVTSWEPIPGAIEALAELRDSGQGIRYLTNTTSVPASEIVERLEAVGAAVGNGELLTAGVLTAEHLASQYPGKRALLLNDGPTDDLEHCGVEWVAPGARADVVVIGSAGQEYTWAAMNSALRSLVGGAALVVMNGGTSWMTAEGPCLDGGAYGAMLEHASGVEATVVGKPAPEMFRAGLRSLGCRPEEALMIGDDVNNDVLAAQALGIGGVLVRTGKFDQRVVDAAPDEPDQIIDSLGHLPGRLPGPA